jgi:hypothetical protein
MSDNTDETVVEIAVWGVDYAYNVGGTEWRPGTISCTTHRSAVMEASRMRQDRRFAHVSVSGPRYQRMPA